jgi:hypothetical protein
MRAKLVPINEYLNVDYEENLEKAQKDKEIISVYWDNGNIQIGGLPKFTQEFGMHIISFRVNYRTKEIINVLWDDWSDFKIIRNVQKAIKDFIKLGFIDESWKIVMTSKESTKRNLKGTTVKKLLQYDAEFTKSIPFAYHGTSDIYLDQIERLGVAPSKYLDVDPNWNMGYSEESSKNVYLSIDFARAKYYAEHTVEKVGGNPIVVEIHDLPIDNVGVDDDIKTNMGYLQLLTLLQSGKEKLDYLSGIRSSSQFAYQGRIPSKLIYKIHKYES